MKLLATIAFLALSLPLGCCLPHIVWRDPDAADAEIEDGNDAAPDRDVILVIADGGSDATEAAVDAGEDSVDTPVAPDVIAISDAGEDVPPDVVGDTPPVVHCASNPCPSWQQCMDTLEWGALCCAPGSGTCAPNTCAFEPFVCTGTDNCCAYPTGAR